MRTATMYLAGGCLVALVLNAGAQQSADKARPVGSRLITPTLLKDEDVLKELRLTDAQRAELKKLTSGPTLLLTPNPTPAEQATISAVRAAAMAGADIFVRESLTPEQQKRFHQIRLQAVGPAAFSDDEVQRTLTLTDDQKGKVTTILREWQTAKRNATRPAKLDRNGLEEWAKKGRAVDKDYAEKMKGILTDEQKKLWSDVIGSPFESKSRWPSR